MTLATARVKDKTTPLHVHPETHEMTYVIDGEIEVPPDGNRSRVRSGGMSFVPMGVAHAFVVVSAEAQLLTIHPRRRRPSVLPGRKRTRRR